MNQRPVRVRQSILDRLTKHNEQLRGPAVGGDSSVGRTPRDRWDDSVGLLKANVLRDLEWLLNTRETGDPAAAPWDEVERSIYNYGLPDFASMRADSTLTGTRLAKAIEREIELFEPRLANVRISTREASAGEERRLRFVIEATLRLDPDPEQVEFDTVLELDSGQITLGRDS